MRVFRVLRTAFSPSMSVALLALSIALSSSAYAVVSLTGSNIRDGSIRSADIADGRFGVRSSDVRDNSLGLQDISAIAEAALRGRTGLQGVAGPTGPQGTTGSVDNSLFYNKVESDSRFVMSSGQLLISVPPGMWTFEDPQVTENASAPAERRQEFNYGQPGTAELIVRPTIPVTLGGRPLSMRGAELCYDASAANVTLDGFEVRIYRTTGDLDAAPIVVQTDGIDHDDEACRTYTFPTPTTLSSDDSVVPVVTGKWSLTGAPFSLGRLTLILEPI